MAFIVEQNGTTIATFTTKEQLSTNLLQISQEYVNEKCYIFAHVTAKGRTEFTYSELVDWIESLWLARRVKKEQTHKQVLVAVGVTGWQKKKVWVKK